MEGGRIGFSILRRIWILDAPLADLFAEFLIKKWQKTEEHKILNLMLGSNPETLYRNLSNQVRYYS